MVMSFEKLLESAKQIGNEDFVKDFESAVADVNAKMASSTDRIGVLEKELEGSISKKNKFRDMIKENTGLEEITSDGFKTFLDGIKGEGASDALKADNEKLQAMISEYKTKLDGVDSQYQSELGNMKLNLSIMESGAMDGIESSVAKGLLLDKLKEGATVEDGATVFKDANGATVLKDDGSPLTVSDKMEMLRNDAEYAPFFPDRRKRGGGKGVDDTNPSKHGVRDLSKMSLAEKAKLMASMSATEYQQLVQANLKKGK